MWQLRIPLFVAMVIFWSLMAFGAWWAVQACRNGQLLRMTASAPLISIPFILSFMTHAEAAAEEATRAREAANFERYPMPQSYPRLLENDGPLTTHDLNVYLDQLETDEVVTFNTQRSQPTAAQT